MVSLKFMGIFFMVVLLVVIPICAVFAPVVFVGSLFGNTFGSLEDNFAIEYDGNFIQDLDYFIYENKVSPDYDELTGCLFYEATSSPSECLEAIDKDTGLLKGEEYKGEFLELPGALFIGSFADSYFQDIHVLGKYTVSKYEKVGEHEEEEEFLNEFGRIEKKTTIIEEYDWIYYPEILRGKCIENETTSCHIILEDQDVYPYQMITFSRNSSFGINMDEESYEISFKLYQEYTGDLLYSFSKAEVLESDNNHILLRVLANNINIYALYESNEGYLTPLFSPGDIVEASELIAYSEGDTRLYIYNEDHEYINPSLFIYEGDIFSGLGNGTIIIGMEDFAPDFNNRKVWLGYSQGGINPYGDNYMGQCTWFAWGLFFQHYGYDPGFRGDGSKCAYEAYQHLKDRGWTYSRLPSPGSIFSTTNFNHVGIVAGVIDENTMVIVEGNFNHKNDTLSEFISLPDWSMRIVSTREYKPGVGFVFCNPPQ